MIDEETSTRLSTLIPKKRLAFGLLVFERMLPDLIAFSKETSFDASCYLQAKGAAWRAVQNGFIDEDLRQACTQNIPDTEKFSHALTSYALNAALAMDELLEYTRDNQTDHLTYVLSLARDSVDLYLTSLEQSIISSAEEDKRNDDDPLMERERRQEEDDIEFLSSLPDRLDDEMLSIIKGRGSASAPLLPLSH